MISEESAIAASKPAYVQMLEPYEKEAKLNSDPTLNKRVKLIISHLIAQAILVRPEMVNASAMAGGKMPPYYEA